MVSASSHRRARPVLQVQGRYFRQSIAFEQRHQRRQAELPHPQAKVTPGFQVDDTPPDDLSTGVDFSLGQVDVLAVDIEYQARRALLDELQQDDFRQVRFTAAFHAGDHIHLFQVLPFHLKTSAA